MLLSLHIRDFAIIDELEIELGPGMTALTGETGAGKSILLDALGLLLGERSDASWVRSGEERAELTAEFSLADNAEAQAWYAEVNNEYPVVADAETSETLRAFGSFKSDQLNLTRLGENNREAVKLMDRAGWR